MFRRLNRKSRTHTTAAETTVYTPEPKYAVQAEEEKRRSSSSQGGKVTTAQQPLQQPPPSAVKADDETVMTLEEIKLKRKVSVSQSGKVHKKSSRNSVVDIFGDEKDKAELQQWDKSEGTRQPRSTADLQL